MMDKYKRARVQRLVPWRSPRTAAVMAPRIRDNEFALHIIAEEFRGRVLGQIAGLALRSIAADDAFVSGALPGEFLPRELRCG